MDHPDTKQASDIVAHKARNGRSKGSLIIECEICSKRFRYQSDLKNHFESHFRQPAKRGRIPNSVNGYPSTPSRQSGSTSPRAPPPQERQRTRPCIYCGKYFYDLESLFRHESAEAVEFEKETDRFENEKPPVAAGDFDERPTLSYHQVIDRTVEEFGEDYENGYEQSYYGRSPRSLDPYASMPMYYSPPYRSCVPNGNSLYTETTPIQNGGPGVYEHSIHQPPQYVHVVPQAPQVLPAQYNNNHTSQYTVGEYPPHNGYRQVTPPPAHEDQTTQHGFLPPPPALPIPEFTQVCHKRTDVEFPDPNEERTYTYLQSKDESHTSSLLHVNSMSPSREVLDLSMPKEGGAPKIEVNEIDTNGHTEVLTNGNVSSDVVDSSIEPEVKIDDQVAAPKIEDHEEEEEDTETVSFEPSSMPSMPEANIALTKVDQTMNGLTEQEWKEFEEFGMFDEDEFDPFNSRSPAILEDPTRIDCKHCGMLFNDAHVRKFHEESHGDGEEDYDDGEMTRLFCGFCGKTFKKAMYRMLHEKSHTGELPVTCTICSRQFRWESELRAHNKLFCTVDKPARPMNGSKRGRPSEAKIRPRLIDQDDWIDNHESLPAGWRMRTRPRPAQEGQMYFIFMSPDFQVFHSRKAVIQHMQKVGGYSQSDFDRVRAGAKPGPRAKRGRRGRGGPGARLGRMDEKRADLNSSVSNMDFENSMDSTMDNDKKDSDSEDATEGSCTKWREDVSLPKDWKIRAMEHPSGKMVYQYLSPDETIFHSRKEILAHMKKDSHLFSQSDINKVGFEYKRKETVETKKWVDLKVKQFRKKVPKRKNLVTNQVIVKNPSKIMRKAYIENEEENYKDLSSEAFRFEPVIFVPRLSNVVKNIDIENILTSSIEDIQQKTSIPINCVHTDEELTNNIDELKEELKERQLDFDAKISDAEEEVDSGPSTPVRSLRNKARLIYEEAPLEDEIDKKVWQQMMQARKDNASKLVNEPEKKAPTEPEKRTSNEPEKRMPTIISLNPTKKPASSQNGSVHGDEEDDCFSDSFEEELLALKRNPREKMRFCSEDVAILDEWFEKSPYPDKKEQKEIGRILMVPSKNVRIWFQNKRVKTKEHGKMLSKMDYKKKPEDINTASIIEEDDDAKYCKSCKQTFSSSLNFKLHNKRFHDGKEAAGGNFNAKSSIKTNSRVSASIGDEDSVGFSDSLPDLKPASLPGMEEYVASKKRFEKYQIKGLKSFFSWNKYPSKDEVLDLSRELNLTVKSVNGWFTNQRHRDKIQSEARERLMSSPAMQRLQGSKVVKEKWLTNHSNNRPNYKPMAWMDEKVPYNPGHKKTKFDDYQKAYLKNFFLQKQYVDEDDISELSAELQLAPKVLRIWFQHARERKKKNLPITSSARGKIRGRGRGRGRPQKTALENEKIDLDSDDEGLFNLDGDLEEDIPARPLVFASKSRGSGIKSNLSGTAFKWTEFQKVYLEDFYTEIQQPDADDMDYLCEHVDAPRQNISEWFDAKNKENEYENKDSVLCSKSIINELISNIEESKDFTFVPPVDLSCQYCGMDFEDEYSLSVHEQIEAEEFEPEKYNTRMLESQDSVSMGSPEELSKYNDFNSEDEEMDELSFVNKSPAYMEIIKNGYNSIRKKQIKKKDKPKKAKRPLNPFMLWLKDERIRIKESGEDRGQENPADFLRDLSARWKSMSEDEKKPYNEESRRLTNIHMQEHPELYSARRKLNQVKPAAVRKGGPNGYEDVTSDFKRKTVTTFKGYFCKKCRLGFYLKSSLFKHLKYYHPEEPLDAKRHELTVGIIIGQDEPEGDMKVMKCDDCRSEFQTRSELSRHLYQHHQEMNNVAEPTSVSVPSSRRSQYIDEEPVTFEAFRKYFDMEDADPQDPKDFFDTSSYSSTYTAYPTYPSESISYSSDKVGYSQDSNGYDEPKKERVGGTKTRFTEYQRGILMASFHKSLHMSKNDAKEMYEDLAVSLELPSKIVRIWFQNARSARKRGNPMYS